MVTRATQSVTVKSHVHPQGPAEAVMSALPLCIQNWEEMPCVTSWCEAHAK